MDTDYIKDYAIRVLLEETPKEQAKVKLNFFTHLINNGLVDYQRLKKGCINHFYDKIIKETGVSDKNAVLEAAMEFDCAPRTVQNVIYKFNDVRLMFN